jgi:rubrerythrin
MKARTTKKPAARSESPLAAPPRIHADPTSHPGAESGEESEFLARAWAMEVEAVERYSMLADAMEEHNNPEVAELFRKLARIEQLHADGIVENNEALQPQEALAVEELLWEMSEGMETTDPGELHYRMKPYHALQMALAAEQRANQFFVKMARAAKSASVRKTALEMAAEEEEHVRLIEDWINRTPRPDDDWAYDPDPPASAD